MDNMEFYADNLVDRLESGETMIKYFEHNRRDLCASHSIPELYETEKEINEYAIKERLKIISSTCDRDKGMYVIFEKKV